MTSNHTPAGAAVRAFREYLAVHEVSGRMDGRAVDDMALDLARIALGLAAQPSGQAHNYDGNHVENHCPECNEYESECACGEQAQQDAAWTGLADADAALVMLDRLDVGPDDDERIDAIAATVRNLAQRSAERHPPPLERQMTPYGMIVRGARLIVGTTLYQMAQECGFSSTHLSGIETGRKPLDAATACAAQGFFRTRGLNLDSVIDAARQGQGGE